MRRSHGKTVNNTVLAEPDAFDSTIVRYNDNHGSAAAGVRHAGDGLRALCDEFVSFRPPPVVHAHLMAGLQEARRHASAHTPQSDESYLHDNTPLLLCTCLRGS